MQQMNAQAQLCLPLDSTESTLERVGGKGASLARMAGAGLPVPPGFHLTTAAYRRFVEANNLQPAIVEAATLANIDEPASLERASATIQSLFERGAVPEEVAAAIRQAYTQLGGESLPVAVRSSATAEDLPGMSFAGQQESYLNVHGHASLLDAVKRCWASHWTARAIGYRARHNIAPQDVSLAVVVQRLVPAEAAGVMFTVDPLTGSPDQVTINAAWGLGEAVVGGQVIPDTFVVDRASGTIAEQTVGEKIVMTVRTEDPWQLAEAGGSRSACTR
jgi:rifampicin phosphotransferase